MTDDDPRLRDQLRARADAVRVTPDLSDVERRSADRRRRRTRAAGAGLALVAVLGSVGGFALGRASSNPKDTIVATGQPLGGGSGNDDGSVGDNGTAASPDGPPDYARPFPFIGERTTEEGLRLRVHATAHDSANEGDPCLPDRFVRVGVAGTDVIGVIATPVYDASATYTGTTAFTGVVDGRLVQVAIVATTGTHVTAVFANGTTDEAEVHDGLAVLAVYDGMDDPEQATSPHVVQLILDADQPQQVTSQNQSPCATELSTTTTAPSTVDDKPALPAPGEQPADAESAEQQVRTAFVSAFDQTLSTDERAAFIERPEVWKDANARLRSGQYQNAALDLHAEVDALVFTSPTQATVRFQLRTTDTRVPRYQLGDAVLVDGHWLVATAVQCDLMALAGITCNYDL